jgi:transketolase
MVVEVPCDYYEAMKATTLIAENKKPSYLRLERESSVSITTIFSPFESGKAYTLWESEDPEVLIIGCGSVLYEALIAAKELEKERIDVIVLNNHTIKPMDEKTILELAKKCIGVVTIEDHQISGGMGSSVCELLSKKCPKYVKMLGVNDRFGETGSKEELYPKYGLTSKDIILAVREVLR